MKMTTNMDETATGRGHADAPWVIVAGDMEGWRSRFAPLAATLRRRTWDVMAAEMVEGELHAIVTEENYVSCPA
jgi:hypothetical protein